MDSSFIKMFAVQDAETLYAKQMARMFL